MTKKAEETLVYEKDGLQIIIKTEKNDPRIFIYKTIIQNLFVRKGAEND